MMHRICDLVDRKTSELFVAVFMLIGIFGLSHFEEMTRLICKTWFWLSGTETP